MTSLKGGFVIGDDGRVVLLENAPTGYWLTKPINMTLVNNCAVQHAVPVTFSNGQGYNAGGLLTYVDVAAAPLATPLRIVGGMPYNDKGQLVCDSVGEAKVFTNGLPFTASGALCIKATAPPPPPEKPGIPVPTWGAITDTSLAMQFVEVSGSKPITYWAEIKANGGAAMQVELDVVYASQDVFGKLLGLTPGTPYTAALYATNAGGSSAKAAAYSFATTDSAKPAAPVLDAVYAAKTSLVFAYTYPTNLEPLFYTAYAFDGTKTVKAEVYDPDQDSVVQGLTEGVSYTCWVTATSADGIEGPKSNEIKITCATVIAAPTLLSVVGGNGMATVTFTPVAPPTPWVVDHYSYAAINVNKPDDPEVEGYIGVAGKIVLANDITWSVAICAVCNPGLAPGDFSARIEVTPEQPRVPYTPKITAAYANPDGSISVSWAKGLNGNGNRESSGTTVDAWSIGFTAVTGKGADFTIDVPSGATTTTKSKIVDVGQWEVTVCAHNSLGWSDLSIPVSVTYDPAVKAKFIGGVSYSDGVYEYILLNSGMTTGYEVLRTVDGANTPAEILLVGAGGAGRGQTLLGAKGGDGGGGQLVVSTLPVAGAAGSIMVDVPNGAKGGSGDTPINTKIKEGSFIIEAVAGKSATDKNDAVGYAKTEVPVSWQKLSIFAFLQPGSHFTGGVSISTEQNFPNATFTGEGGAGTKGTVPGKGGESFAAIRWLK